MGEIIDFKDVTKLNRIKRIRENARYFPLKILDDMNFNQTFGFNLNYSKLGETSMKGILAWIKATDFLANWEHDDSYAVDWIDIMSEHYMEGLSLTDISKRRNRDINFGTIKHWLTVMQYVGIKYGFPLWVKYGVAHTITSDELIKMQSMYAKFYYELLCGKFPKETTVENLYPFYCTRIREDADIDLNKSTHDAIMDYINYCELETIRNCIEFKDILNGENWFNKDFEDIYCILEPEDKELTSCVITLPEEDSLEW